jgi:uncharacterized membrane protein YhaH (DUF805 family)
MGFINSVKYCILNIFNFKPRGSRSEFWFYAVFMVLFTIFMLFPFEYVSNRLESFDSLRTEFSDTGFTTLEKIYYILLLSFWLPFLPLPAAIARRLHDIGRSGLWQLLPFLWVIIFFIVALALGAEFGGVLYIVFMGTLVGLPVLSTFLILFWLSKKGQPEPNKYGPVN